MDIVFHYFAVKTMALKAGFSEPDAQIIAQSSQMVDDFDFTGYWRCNNVPDYIAKHPEKYDLCVALGFFNPAQTGFLCDGLMGYTDYVNLLFERFQKFTCSPFHFIPQHRDADDPIVKEYRVVPAELNDGSIISDLLEEAMEQYQAARSPATPQPKQALMRIGILLHIFADTVAHQMFSGFNANVNLVELVEVTNNDTGDDETEKYRTRVQRFLKRSMDWAPKFTPAIGHMMLEHIPDLTHLSFEMSYDGKRYRRDNTEQFIKMAKQILDYLCDCRESPRIEEKDWKAIEQDLRTMFKLDITPFKDQKEIVANLAPQWSSCFDYSYSYDGETLKKDFAHGMAALQSPALANVDGMEQVCLDHLPSTTDIKLLGTDLNVGGQDALLSTEASEDFYCFNVVADEVLIELYGARPRKFWFADQP